MKKLVKIFNGKCNICCRSKNQIFHKYITKGQDFEIEEMVNMEIVTVCHFPHGLIYF